MIEVSKDRILEAALVLAADVRDALRTAATTPTENALFGALVGVEKKLDDLKVLVATLRVLRG